MSELLNGCAHTQTHTPVHMLEHSCPPPVQVHTRTRTRTRTRARTRKYTWAHTSRSSSRRRATAAVSSSSVSNQPPSLPSRSPLWGLSAVVSSRISPPVDTTPSRRPCKSVSACRFVGRDAQLPPPPTAVLAPLVGIASYPADVSSAASGGGVEGLGFGSPPGVWSRKCFVSAGSW